MIGIGFSGPRVSLERLPGYDVDSWGYHGDDGMTFCCQSTGKKYGPTFTTNDVVGCGVNFMTGCAFFTKNGALIPGIFTVLYGSAHSTCSQTPGNAFRDLKEIKLYPSVGAKRPGAHLRVNFGQMPFMFDIDGMMTVSRSSSRIYTNDADCFAAAEVKHHGGGESSQHCDAAAAIERGHPYQRTYIAVSATRWLRGYRKGFYGRDECRIEGAQEWLRREN